MIISILFYTALILQLWLVSIHYANRILVQMKFVTDNYSETEYPKLYPKSKAHFIKTYQWFKNINSATLLLSLSAIALLIYGKITENYQPPNVVAAIIFMVQLIPFALLELSEYSYFSAIRKQSKNAVRTSTLTRRSISTFVPTKIPVAALTLLVTAIGFDIFAYANEAPTYLGLNEQALYRALTLIICNLLLLTLILCNVYGKKLDPFQENNDRFTQVSLTISTLFYCSICLSLFFILKSLLYTMNIQGIEASVTAIYTIIIAYVSVGQRVRCMNFSNVNFDIYKA